MKTTKITSGIYKISDKNGTVIIRKICGEDTNTISWIANECDTLDDCNDNNSCCVAFKTKKELINWIKSF